MTADSRTASEAAVRACYSTWASTYHRDYYASDRAYPPVHQRLVRDLIAASGAKTLIDAGCGPASMLRSLADLGADLYGFDLTPEMVAEARAVMSGHAVPPDHIWEGSVTDPAAFRGPSTPDAFDAALLIGVLPHVSEADEPSVLRNLHGALTPGGLVAVEARNQLFGLFTANRYTFEFLADDLVRAGDLRRRSAIDPAVLDGVLDEMRRHVRMDLPPVRHGHQGEPGYDEVLSRTHNPFVLRQRLEAAGFRDLRVLFYHYHCLPPMFEAAMPDAYRALSVELEDPHDWRGHFMASAFIVAGTKT